MLGRDPGRGGRVPARPGKAVVESAEKSIPKVDAATPRLPKVLGQPADLTDLLAERAKLNGQAESS
jgi:hypothetical protein